MATIKEIAAIAGVSRGTVDRVLNNRGSVNPGTRQRIEEIAARLNYEPNKAGLMLASQKKNYTIGVILFSDSTLFFDEIMDGINARATEFSGYNVSVSIVTVPFEEESQLSAINSLCSKGINGLLLAPYNSQAIAEKIDEMSRDGIPVVTVNTDIQSDRLAYVGCDFYRSGVTAAGLVGHMTSGSVKVGIITGSSHVLCHTERIEGFSHRIRDAYHNISIVDIAENHDDDNASYCLVEKMLSLHPDINCLFFTAGGVSGGCRAVENTPHRPDLQIFAYDNIAPTVENVKRGLITAIICQQQYQQGYQAFDLLARYILEGKNPENEYNYLDIDIRLFENI